MQRYEPWYYKLSFFQCIVFGALATVLVMFIVDVAFRPEEALLKIDIIFDPQKWGGLRSYYIIGEFTGTAFVGVFVGWAGYQRLKKKQQDLRQTKRSSNVQPLSEISENSNQDKNV